MVSARRDLSPDGAGAGPAQISHALTRAGLTDAEATRWWNQDRDELGGDTARQAWRAGNHLAVKAVAERLVSERFAEALNERPDITRRLLDAPSAS